MALSLKVARFWAWQNLMFLAGRSIVDEFSSMQLHTVQMQPLVHGAHAAEGGTNRRQQQQSRQQQYCCQARSP
jgi:hypothetical protein